MLQVESKERAARHACTPTVQLRNGGAGSDESMGQPRFRSGLELPRGSVVEPSDQAAQQAAALQQAQPTAAPQQVHQTAVPGQPAFAVAQAPGLQHAVAGAGPVGLPAGVAAANPWMRLVCYLLEGILLTVTFGIGWLIWAATTASTGQTPAKRLMKLRVIGSETMRPVSFGKMFWLRGLLAGIVASFAIPISFGILLLMPFWDKRNQNLWDKVSGTYVVSDPANAWAMSPDLR